MVTATSPYLNQPLYTQEEVRKFLKKNKCSTCAHWRGDNLEDLAAVLQQGVCSFTKARTHINYASDTCDYYSDDWVEEHV